MTLPLVTTGYLGWSNVRSGLEFYVGKQGNARWLPRHRPNVVFAPPEKGALLQDELEDHGCFEGSSVVVIALPGRLPERLANHLAMHLAACLDDLIVSAEETAMAVEEAGA